MGDLNIISTDKQRGLISKGPKYCELKSITRSQNIKLIMNTVEDYDMSWAKREDVEVDTLSEWVKSIRKLVKCRIYVLS